METSNEILNYGNLYKTLAILKEHSAAVVAYVPQIVCDPEEAAYLDLIKAIMALEAELPAIIE